MLRLSLGAVALLALGALVAPALDDKDTAIPYAGRWKVTFVRGDHCVSFCIVSLNGTFGDPRGKAVATLPKFTGAKVRNLKIDAGSVRFTVVTDGGSYQVVALAPKGETEPKMLYATIQGPTELYLGRLELTEQDELKEREDVSVEEGFDQFIKLMNKEDLDEKIKILRGIAENYAGKPAGVAASQQLVQKVSRDPDATEADLEAAVKSLLESAQPFGRELEIQSALTAARDLLKVQKGVGVAVAVAQRAEKLLTDADPPGRAYGVLKALTDALRKLGKDDEAKAYDARLAKLNVLLDEEFEKNSIPFKPEKFEGRKGKGQRVAVVELFTGAQCPPCVAADIAFDAALKTYGPSDVIFLQYHLHIPGPDALVNPATEARAKYYEEHLQGTPSAFLDGKATAPLGGFRENGEDSYNALRKQLDAEVEKEADAEIKLSVSRKGDRIDVKADVVGLKKYGDKVRLRLVLVEEVARYAGGNGQRLHRHVVRGRPGGWDGLALKEATATQNVRIDLAEVRKEIDEYLTEKNKDLEGFFARDEMQVPLKDLSIVALIQDDVGQQILQAAQIKVPAAE